MNSGTTQAVTEKVNGRALFAELGLRARRRTVPANPEIAGSPSLGPLQFRTIRVTSSHVRVRMTTHAEVSSGLPPRRPDASWCSVCPRLPGAKPEKPAASSGRCPLVTTLPVVCRKHRYTVTARIRPLPCSSGSPPLTTSARQF